VKAFLLALAALPLATAPGLRAGPVAPSAGERAFQKCYSCHSIEAVQAKLSGPPLAGILGRQIAAEPRFEYSPAMKRFAAREPIWTAELLDRYIADPEATVPGTSMAVNGITDRSERAALIAFLSRQ
jgi:cytochrome c2